MNEEIKTPLTAISLFAGVGGICKGFMNNGVQIVFANDMDDKACMTYRLNFTHPIVKKKIEDIDASTIPDADILLFGFPCQAFSIAGKQLGFNDKRGHLFFESLRIIKEKQPKVIFLENVKNLVLHDNGNTFKVITSSLISEGYYLKYKVLNSSIYGNVPQNRERIYVVGFKDKEQCNKFQFPDPFICCKTKITDITKPSQKKPDNYYYNNTKYYPMLKEAMTNKETVYQLRRVYVRENKNNVCPTLTANMGTGGHNVPLILDDFGIRKLTPTECFLLQGFHEDYILPFIADCHLYKQAGNSVTVTVIDRIAKNIVNALK